MAWSVAVLDQGISNWFERTYKRNLYEYDFDNWDAETDYGQTYTHGTYVAMTARMVNPALDFIDLKVMDNRGYVFRYTAEPALDRVISLSDRGYGIGAINLSWGGGGTSEGVTNALSALARRGIFAVVSSGNNGSANFFEGVDYPASLSTVIAVGAHDGAGNPVAWSQNNPSEITVLADGTDMPVSGIHGTSVAAPQVAATVASLQAYARRGLGRTLSLAEVKDTLQLGGNGPRSNPDPADGRTRYFLYDHGGTVSYFVNRYLLPTFEPMSYLASNLDLVGVYGLDRQAALQHFLSSGAFEGRQASFDAWSYLAVNPDVAAVMGVSAAGGATHYLSNGRAEGRRTSFESWSYLASNPDLIRPLGTTTMAAARHYVQYGRGEGRSTTSFDAMRYIASYYDLSRAFGVNGTLAATQHYVVNGYAEGRRATFDGMAYLAANRDLAVAFGADTGAATLHYVANRFRENRPTTFDAYLYLASNTDLIAAFGANTAAATEHYVRHGQREGRGLGFSAYDYLDANPDLDRAFGGSTEQATRHYVQYGLREGRPTLPDPATASVSETTVDLPASTATSGRVSVGGRVTGRYTGDSYSSDTDWYGIRLRAGQTIQVSLTAHETANSRASYQYIHLRDSRGQFVTYSLNLNGRTPATLTHTVTTTDNYFLSAQGDIFPTILGRTPAPVPYTLAVSAIRSAAPLTGSDAGSGALAAAV